ncbi:hypothetical protein KW798_03035 [Candidatus Parcubacteria bacterium]|nr:hypothetical protein [Candidatus Parcubacteria bacterium]
MTNGAHPPHPEQKVTAKDRILQVIAVIGLIAVLLLGAWGIIQLAFNLPGIFSNVGGSISNIFTGNVATTTVSNSREMVTVTAPDTITNNQAFTLSWKHTNGNGQYGYNISYSCVTGVTMKAPLPNGAYQKVDCNTPFNYTNAKDKTTLTPVFTGNPGKVTFTVAAMRLSNNTVAVTGTASTTAGKAPAAPTTVAKTPTPSTTKTSTPGSTYYASGRTSNLYGYPDLAVTINSVNSLSSVYGRTVVTFTIQNVGTNAAFAGWTFNADLPVNDGYLFQSALQQPLYPGDRIVYTLSFDNPHGYDYNDDYGWDDDYRYQPSPYGIVYGGDFGSNSYNYSNSYSNNSFGGVGPVTITVDPYNQVLESNENNNTASVR